MGPAQRFVMHRIADYATDEIFSNFEMEISIPDHATFGVDHLRDMLEELGLSWEIRKPIDGDRIKCNCGRRWKTYRMANNRIHGLLSITMLEYIPDSDYMCHTGYPYPFLLDDGWPIRE
ncbi:unnamed protein product [Caenorhabditis nigoni]